MFLLKPLTKYKTVYVAVSMGIDSLSLYSFLKDKHSDVKHFHVNHSMIHEDNDIAQFYNNWAEYTNTKTLCYTNHSVNTKKQSLEAWGHDIRQSFYEQICKDPSVCVVTAHHLDDAVESYLMNCFRGQGEYMPIAVETQINQSAIIRPALSVTKSQLNSYLDPSWVEFIYNDPLNKSDKSMRNLIRNQIIPTLDPKVNLRSVVKKKFYN